MCTNNGIPGPMTPREQNKQMQQNQAAPFPPMNYYQPSPYPNNWRGTNSDRDFPMQGVQSQQPAGYGYSPVNVLDQMRNCSPTSSPIFILPNGVTCNNPMQQMPSATCVTPIPTCIPYTIPMPIFQPYGERSS